ncbi:hypothetical protein QUF15_12650 [Lactococcus lactis]|nr:hypothetical protein [Lactococcus lactis]MDM7511108.1 hypothetical protein [Lactococcus lactis]UNO31490.1 hypothetical protein MN088_12925 [Lactococcus lactis]
MEPALKEAIKIAGKKKGKLQGGAMAVIREALIEHFKKNKDYFNYNCNYSYNYNYNYSCMLERSQLNE